MEGRSRGRALSLRRPGRLADAGQPLNTEITPLQVLLERRPDIQHLPLTCENTNTPLPYIDLVNETLEYFMSNQRPFAGRLSRATAPMVDVPAEELLANPQFVSDAAYTTLGARRIFPPPLPFHQPLETLRRYFDQLRSPAARGDGGAAQGRRPGAAPSPTNPSTAGATS